MLTATTSPLGSQDDYIFVTAFARYRGQLLLSRHRLHTTWETQGGHIEPGETPLKAIRRELYEEAGALDFTVEALCDYSAAGTHGVFYFANIARLGPLPPSEMAEVCTFTTLPPNLTYPGITPVLWGLVRHRFGAGT